MTPGVRVLRHSTYYTLVDGRTLYAALDADEGGIAFTTPARTVEYVLRPSQSGGRPCTALWERRWTLCSGDLAATLWPTDYTLDDLVELQS